MIKIYEKQYEVGNKENSQERIISSYPSFEDYTEHLLNDKSREIYNSLPRQCKIIEHKINGNAVTLEFEHPVFQKNFIHTAVLVGNK